MTRLSILMPSNRDNLFAYSRIAQACSWAGPELEVIIRDNSGSAAKRQFLSQIARDNCHLIAAEPCEPLENWTQIFRQAKGDFAFFLSDDDTCFDRAIAALPKMIEEIADDKSVIGITGAYLIEGTQGSSIFSYQNIESNDVTERISGYLSSSGPNIMMFAPIRRQVVSWTHELISAMPFAFSFNDQIISLLYLLHGKFIRLNRLMYTYDFHNWEATERGQRIDLDYYTAAKQDHSINKLHWFLCAFEGATLIRNLVSIPNYSLQQRQSMADLWFSTMFHRFMNHKREDIGSALSREADILCVRWKSAAGQLSFHDMLADICGFMSLSSKENGQKYYNFWNSILHTGAAPAA